MNAGSSPNVSPKTLWIATAVYGLAIFTLTHLPPRDLPPVPISDKVEHMTAYGVLGILLFAALRAGGRSILKTVLLTLTIGLLYGIADELLQIPVGRTCDVQDWFADAGGIIVAITICSTVEWIGRGNTKPN